MKSVISYCWAVTLGEGKYIRVIRGTMTTYSEDVLVSKMMFVTKDENLVFANKKGKQFYRFGFRYSTMNYSIGTLL